MTDEERQDFEGWLEQGRRDRERIYGRADPDRAA
jgi:hypothetical protein